MGIVQIKDKKFEISIPEAKIKQRIKEIAAQINHDYEGKHVVFLSVLNGSFMVAADLYREITLECEITFIKLASYAGTETTGEVMDVIGLTNSIEGKDVIIVEDIVDTGLTMQHLLKTLKTKNPKSLKICTLLTKPEKRLVDLTLDYVAFSIPNLFVVGYGLDYDQEGRNLKDIYQIIE